jgi:hypothetical protein
MNATMEMPRSLEELVGFHLMCWDVARAGIGAGVGKGATFFVTTTVA